MTEKEADMGHVRTFGPVPSRRLGRSLGINNIPPKFCTYSCVYCQLGRSSSVLATRKAFYDPEDLFAEVRNKLRVAGQHGESIDFLTIVPDGEPTLDLNLGRLIGLLKGTGLPVAVITNGSLLGIPEVRRDLAQAEWVSVKVDTINANIWRKIDRPHKVIFFDTMLPGIESFARNYQGRLMTETMLVKDLNDSPALLMETARFLHLLRPEVAYLSIPTRPPAEPWVEVPDEPSINRAYHIFREQGLRTELLTGYEGNEFSYTGNLEQDLLGITSVHPMREDALLAFLNKAGADTTAIDRLVAENKLVVSEYQGSRFYLRKFKRVLRPTPPDGH